MHKVIALFRRVPLLPITILSAIPVALFWDWRPWGSSLGDINPSLGQYVVIALVAYSVFDALKGMVESLKEGHVGVDILAVLAILSTLAVRQYWASWAVVLMIWSGEAIEEYAQAKAESNLTLLVSAAPQEAHVSDLPGVGKRHEGQGQGLAQGEAQPEDRQLSKTRFQSTQTDAAGRDSGSAGKPSGLAHPADKASATTSHFHTVDVESVKLGDVLVVLPGETVPVDGQLLSGTATLDLSNINGEPVPRQVYAGARVMSGAVNGATTLMMRATQLAHDSQYQKILQLVSSARSSRAPVVRTADLLAVPFTLISLVIASVAWYLTGVPMRFAQVLVLATPCPLLIAAPVAYMAGTGRLAKAGVLIKAQEVLENLGRVTHIFFDKTGTLTMKKPQVVRIDLPLGQGQADGTLAAGRDQAAAGGPDQGGVDAGRDRILALAGVVETYSVHILAKGISTAGGEALRRQRSQEVAAGLRKPSHLNDYPVVAQVVEDQGQGISGQIDGVRVSVGRFDYVTRDMVKAQSPAQSPAQSSPQDSGRGLSQETSFPESLYGPQAPDQMNAFVAIDGVLAARIVLKDLPRPDARQSVEALAAMGIEHLTMVTGDNEASAWTVAKQVGISEVDAGLLPEGKVKAVRRAREATKPAPWWDRLLAGFSGQGKGLDRAVSMMVGDGVNDAPVLAAADIGMAITDGTSTAASESAQVVIMNDDISAVPEAIAIARQTKRVMLQSVVAGLGLAIVCMIAAAFNLIPVVVGAFMQEGIDVVSILWALTALLDRRPDSGQHEVAGPAQGTM
ncbi:heavy metal translocating P-type ATPase [Bifidobacterium aemilianum]|uniref:Heavy metal translocating P-type ATPase n=1 Tax=Bifidobacterium aemilianum TaxID=2493120 RepID=A0A366K7T4_9BIFI|nr:heavy metal translocating P-type ATPase [Bifidobacterium aemilianum]RBP97810.1 heavy metal translocating P-type ATPase [Bifidobacterium aemilianum]